MGQGWRSGPSLRDVKNLLLAVFCCACFLHHDGIMILPNTKPVGFTDRLLHIGTLGLLILAFLTGGESREYGWGDAATQLLALPILLLAVHAISRSGGGWQRQILLPLALLGPMAIAVQLVFDTTSTPWATERALYAWLPPVAVFLGCAALPISVQRQGLALLIALVAASLLLAILQLAAPQDSIFNPFPELRPAFNGLFANQNHQATALAIAAILLLTWSARTPSRHGTGSIALAVVRIGLAVLFLVAIPVTGSRGMALIAATMLLALPWANGWMYRQVRGKGGGIRRVAIAVAVQVAGFALVTSSTLGWMEVDQLEEIRGTLRDTTAAMARDVMPFGSGIGSFVPWFEAHMPDDLLRPEYYNHAHNEYVQWWLEGGVLGLGWIFLLILGFWWTHPRRAHDAPRPDGSWVGCWLGIGCVLAHSFVDYPLRTPALATAAAWMAAVMATHAIDFHRFYRAPATKMIHPSA